MGKIEHLFEKITDKAEDFGEKTSEKAEEILEKVADKAEKIGEEKKPLPKKVIIFAAMLITILTLALLLLTSENRNDKKVSKLQSENEELKAQISELNEKIDELIDQLTIADRITVEDVKLRLDLVGELTTAKSTFHGFIHFKEGSIPILAQKSFIMFYEAEMSAYFDLEKVGESVTITDTTVELTLPPVTYTAIRVDADSIQIFDQHFSLFKREEMDDLIDCLAKAEEDAKYKYDKKELEAQAIAQAKTVFRNLLADIIGDRQLIIHDSAE